MHPVSGLHCKEDDIIHVILWFDDVDNKTMKYHRKWNVDSIEWNFNKNSQLSSRTYANIPISKLISMLKQCHDDGIRAIVWLCIQCNIL